MTESRDLLIELGTEELPPKALGRLSEALGQGMLHGLERAGLGHGESTLYASPRRLAVLIRSLAGAQPNRILERRGPALAAAFDADGNPTRAALGFAGSCGVQVDALERAETDKGAWLVFRSPQPGLPTVALIPDIVSQALAGLPIPKRMRWGSLTAEFVRPVHWLVLLYGDEVIDMDVLGVRAGRETRGHRFHHPQPLLLGAPADYAPLLETEGKVQASLADRRAAVRAQVAEAATAVGGRAVIDEALLNEVSGLVEWPVALLGRFDTRFLDVPAEALVAAMKGHLKYFHVVDAKGSLLPYFVTVSNIESKDPGQVVAGNERVIRPRLSDAAFFWSQDRKQRLESRRDRLKGVVFQERLGTLEQKSRRVAAIAQRIAEVLRGDVSEAQRAAERLRGDVSLASLARRAAELSKCDLVTDMVGEFPELQGTMGRYYAVHDGEPPEVAQALDEQYLPRFAGDALPQGTVGQALAVADRLDTLVGIFGIGQPPTGDKDPFGLRRAALGVMRILIEQDLDLDLETLLHTAYTAYGDILSDPSVGSQVLDFMLERLRTWYSDMGVRPDTFESVLARRPTRPRDFHRRIQAVSEFRRLPEAASLAAANKRVHNILRQAAVTPPARPDPGAFVEQAEHTLAEQLDLEAAAVAPLLAAGDYAAALAALAALREPVDSFFDEVMVMVDDAALRLNRLALLSALRELFLRVADISRLQA